MQHTYVIFFSVNSDVIDKTLGGLFLFTLTFNELRVHAYSFKNFFNAFTVGKSSFFDFFPTTIQY